MNRLRSILQGIVGALRSLDSWLSQNSWYRITRNTFVGFTVRQGSRSAAAMTYFAVFSIFPFILLLIALLSFLLNSDQAKQEVINGLSNLFPSGSTDVQTVIEGVINARGIAVGFGIVLLVWGALGWFQAIDQGVNEMWGVKAVRPFPRGQLFALGMIGGIGLMMLVSWLGNVAVGVLKGTASSVGLLALPGATAFWDLAVAGVTLAAMFLLFLLLFRYSPMCEISWGEVWRGALITAILWEVLRSGFAIYVTHYANFGSAYGSIGAVIVFLVWLYFAHQVILLGAEFTYTMRLEAHGIHEPQDVPCALPERRQGELGTAEGGRRRRPAA